MEDLVDTCIPGDVVTVTGIIGVINNYMDIGGGIDSITLMVLFIVSISQIFDVVNCIIARNRFNMLAVLNLNEILKC